MPKKGYKQTEEHRQKISKEKKGKKRSVEFKIKQSNLMRGNQRGVGHKVSEENKRKISLANKGNNYAKGAIRSKETKQKIGLANSLKIHSKGKKATNWKGGISWQYVQKTADRKKSDKCEICGESGRICFDHDHKTGKFRGWICSRCNSTLGFVKDNKELLQMMIEYLNK